jgi:hypothetical protein
VTTPPPPPWSLAQYKAWNDAIARSFGLPTASNLAQLVHDAKAELALARRCQEPGRALGALAEAVGRLIEAVESR